MALPAYSMKPDHDDRHARLLRKGIRDHFSNGARNPVVES